MMMTANDRPFIIQKAAQVFAILDKFFEQNNKLDTPCLALFVLNVLMRCNLIEDANRLLEKYEKTFPNYRGLPFYYQYNTKAQLLLLTCTEETKDNAEQEAERLLLEVIDILNQQQSKLFQLDCVVPLAELYIRQGKKEKAKAVLEEVLQPYSSQPNVELVAPIVIPAKKLLSSLQ